MHRIAPLLLAAAFGAAACGGNTDGKKTVDKKVDAKKADAKKADAKKADAKKTDAKQDDAKKDDAKQADAKKVDPALLERGKYLAEVVMNCRACHTPLTDRGPDVDKAYAGGLEYFGEFGIWRSPNITQDQRTGIGGWTDEQIIDAVRRGVRPTGEQMFPVMPYEHFSVASDEDMKALVAFLRTIEPIENAVAGNTDLVLEKPAIPEPTGEPAPIDPVAEGEYLAELAHCAFCHTPRDEKGRPDSSKRFAGGRPFAAFPFQGEGKVWSANLTPHAKTGIGKYSDEELMTAIVELDKRDGTAIVGPMTFYVSAWAQFKHKDVKAIVAYLRTLPAIDNAVPKTTWKPNELGAG